MLYRYDEKNCLNGWWDIRLEYASDFDENRVPAGGYEIGAYLVPSFYNKPWDGVKLPGEPYYHPAEEDPALAACEGAEVLFDAFGYPSKWSLAQNAWVRRRFTLHETGPRHFIIAEAAGPRAKLFINGSFVAEYREYTLPFECEITPYVHEGENELVLLLADYEYEDAQRRRTLWPSGGWTPHSMRGLWQDVYLVSRPQAFIDDVTIVTSVREKTLKAEYRVQNGGNKPFEGRLEIAIEGGLSGRIDSVGIAPHGEAVLSFMARWENPELWEPSAPHLYTLCSSLVSDDAGMTHTAHERFGFREVWVDGIHVMLNGHPVHLFSDWGHKCTPYQYTEGWIRQWFGMIRDYNLNHTRLHTNPHPPFILDIADELGIMVTCETALHGSACGQGAGAAAFWEHAYAHARRMVKRDKNHPSVVLWSCENEMRWNTPTAESKRLMMEHLPQIRKLFEQLDPTRPAYHEGDTSCFNESEMPILSRHYGRECTGMGWWDKTRPLHSGEFGLYHLAGPNNTLQFGGDSVFESQDNVNRYALEETEKIVCDARANGVVALGPWNFSCLLNRRTHSAQMLCYDDYQTPGMKPLKVNAHTSEFRFWESDDKGYDSAPLTDGIPSVFAPFAALDLSYRSSFYAGIPLKKEIVFVNDTDHDVNAQVEVFLHHSDGKHTVSGQVTVPRGYSQTYHYVLSTQCSPGKCSYGVRVTESGTVLLQWERDIYLTGDIHTACEARIAVLGDGSSGRLLQKVGAQYQRVTGVPSAREFPVLLLERGYVQPGMTLNRDVASYCADGGRVVILEQQYSLFPGIQMGEKSLQAAFIRTTSTLTQNLCSPELSYWGDTPYSLQSGNTFVADRFYHKDDGGWMEVAVDSGEGNFGDGDLECALLFTMAQGQGMIVATTLNITARYEKVPAAAKLFANMLAAAAAFIPSGSSEPLDLGLHSLNRLQEVDEGKTAVVMEMGPEMAKALSKAAGISLTLITEPEGTYQCIRSGEDGALAGVSNADLSGIEAYNYRTHAMNVPIASHVLLFDPGMTPIAVTAPQSCMRPFYAYSGSTEMLRTYTATRYCANKEEQAYAVAGVIPYGKGRIYVSTFKKQLDGHPRLRRFYHAMLRNLYHISIGKNPLDGACVLAGAGRSKGYPEQVYCLNLEANDTELTHMLKFCTYQNEHINPKPVLEKYPFKKIASPDGVHPREGRGMLIYYTIESRITRRREENDLGLPDPTAETFLDLRGTGNIAVWINGRPACKAEVKQEGVTVSDISIENGFNHILLYWQPQGSSEPLCMQWRNTMHIPETGFVF